jgi:large subunit ribosomal protein L24
VLAVGKEPGVLRVKLSGNPFGDIAVATSISTGTLDANATGTVQAAPGDWPSGMVQVNVKRADLAPLRPDGGKLPVAFSARATSDGKTATFDDISAVVAGSKVRGKMTASLTAPSRIEGRLDADTLDVTALLAAAAGLPKGAEDWSWSSTPFGGGMQHAVTGQVAIDAMQANLAAGLSARQFRGVLDFGDDNVTLGDVSAVVAGGKLTGTIAFKSGFDGVTARLRGALADGDVTALLPRAARPPVGGRLNVTLDLEGAGRSPASLIGSLHGAGTIALSDGHFAGLDPRAFAAVTRAVDQGLAVEAAKIENVASRTLASGRLDVERAEGKLAVGAGQIRLTDAKASGEGAELAMSGVFDLTSGTINARLVLTGSDTAAGARPDIFVALNGPVTAPGKTLDVSGLTGWLTLRAIELQSKKLEAIQAAPKPEAKVEVKPEMKPEAKPEPEPEPKPEPKPEAKPVQSAPPAATAPAKPKEAAAAKKPPAPPPHRPPPQAPSLPPPINILPLVNPPPATR